MRKFSLWLLRGRREKMSPLMWFNLLLPITAKNSFHLYFWQAFEHSTLFQIVSVTDTIWWLLNRCQALRKRNCVLNLPWHLVTTTQHDNFMSFCTDSCVSHSLPPETEFLDFLLSDSSPLILILMYGWRRASEGQVGPLPCHTLTVFVLLGKSIRGAISKSQLTFLEVLTLRPLSHILRPENSTKFS